MKCDRPPLPEKDDDEEKPYQPGIDSDEDTSKKPDKHVSEHTKVTKKSASNRLVPTLHVLIFIICMLFSKRML